MLRLFRERKLAERITEAHHTHQTTIPRLGGVGLVIAFAAGTLVYLAGDFPQEYKEECLKILVSGVAMFCLGMWDDLRPIGAKKKLAGQMLIASAAYFSGISIHLATVPFTHQSLDLGLWAWPLTVLWLVAMMNALNFMDNMNGLCSGVGAICALIFGGIALAHGQPLAATLAAATAGALLGFLPWNFPRAGIFLGDSGSHLTGFLLGALALMPHYYLLRDPSPTLLPVLIPVIVLALPLFDLVAVMWQRWRQGVPVYIGDTNHISHRFVRLGLSPVAAVIVLYMLTAVLGFGAVVLLWAPPWVAALVVAQTLGVLGVVTALQHFGAKRNSAG